MGMESKKPDIHMTSSTSYSLNSLSFSGYLTAKDRQRPNSGPTKTPDKMFKFKTGDQGFEFGPTRRRRCSSVADHESGKFLAFSRENKPGPDDGQRALVVRNNSIRRPGGRRVGEKEDESWWSGWCVFRSFVSPCRECRASKPTAIQRPSS